MRSSDQKDFFKSLRVLFFTYSKKPDPEMYEIWFSLLSEYELDVIRVAFSNYAKNERYPPVPAGVIDYIPKKPIISANEAWAHVPKSEYEGGWINRRMASALAQSAGLGNDTASRMAFIAAYDNLLADEDWFYSAAQGMDYDQQQDEKLASGALLIDRKWIDSSKTNAHQLAGGNKKPAITQLSIKKAQENIKKLSAAISGIEGMEKVDENNK